MSNKIKNLLGQTFGKLKVISRAYIDGYNKCAWTCLCECGSTKVCKSYKLLSGRNKSCGCFSVNKTHGLSKSTEHKCWEGIKYRCNSSKPGTKGYIHYRLRGIKVCDRWSGENGFINFLSDMGPKPSPAHTIERKDFNKDYEPSNCEWLVLQKQARNRRNNTLITINNETKCLAEWCEVYNIDSFVVSKRLLRGWPKDERTFLKYPKFAQMKNNLKMDKEDA